VTENMPGAGCLAGFPLDSAVGGSGKTNAAEFHYVGRVNTSAWSWSTGDCGSQWLIRGMGLNRSRGNWWQHVE